MKYMFMNTSGSKDGFQMTMGLEQLDILAQPNQWLDDLIVDYRLRDVQNMHYEVRKLGVTDVQAHVFTTMFYTKCAEKGEHTQGEVRSHHRRPTWLGALSISVTQFPVLLR
jgi:Ulp1 family protease